MDYSSFNYFHIDPVIYFEIDHVIDPSIYLDNENLDNENLENEEEIQSNEECYDEFEKRLASFKDDDVHKGLGYCPCKSRNRCRRPNYSLHLFKDCASVIYGLSCFHGNSSTQKLILANEQVPQFTGFRNIQLGDWDDGGIIPGTLVFRIDFVQIEPIIEKYDDDDNDVNHEIHGIDEIKRDWRQNLFGLVGARRHRQDELGKDYPPAGIIFSRNWDDKTKLPVSGDGQLLLNGPFLPLVVWPDETMLLDIKLSCYLDGPEQTVTLDVCSYYNSIPPYDDDIEIDEPKTCRLGGSDGTVKVGYSMITRAVYVRFVASIVIASTTSPLDIYGHITVDEHFHENKKSYLFYEERDSCQQLKHGDYLSFYMDSMILREGKELTISVTLYQRSPSSPSKIDDIIFVDGHTSFSPTLPTNEEENHQEKKILSVVDDDDKKLNGINFMIGIIDPRSVFILQP